MSPLHTAKYLYSDHKTRNGETGVMDFGLSFFTLFHFRMQVSKLLFYFNVIVNKIIIISYIFSMYVRPICYV